MDQHNFDDKENEEKKLCFTQNFKLVGLKDDIDYDLKTQLKNMNLNDETLAKNKNKHGGVPFNRTGRSVHRAVNKDCSSNSKNVIGTVPIKHEDPKDLKPKVLSILEPKAKLEIRFNYRPVKPQRPKPLTLPSSPKLFTSIRAAERNKFNTQVRESSLQKQGDQKIQLNKKVGLAKKPLESKSEISKNQSS